MSNEKEFSGGTPADFIPTKQNVDAEKPPTIVKTIIWTLMVTALFAMSAITMNYEYRASLATTQRVLLARIWKIEKVLHDNGIKMEVVVNDDDKQHDDR